MPSHSKKKTMEDEREKLVMKKLKDSILSRLAAINPSVSINSAHVSFIEHRLQSIFNNSFHTPTHPPYLLMIKRAIVKLNEEGGSTEEAISEFIRREYEDLPLAHVRILDIHLRKFCLNGELVRSKNGRYVLVDCDEKNDNDDCLGDAVTEEHSEAENSMGKMPQAPSEAEQPQIQTSKTVRKYDQHLLGTGVYCGRGKMLSKGNA